MATANSGGGASKKNLNSNLNAKNLTKFIIESNSKKF